METTERDPAYERAKKRVEDLKGWYAHVIVYLLVNLGLFTINILTNRDEWWFFWPLIGWGIALAIHTVVLFGVEGRFGRDWEERKIREYTEREHGPRRA